MSTPLPCAASHGPHGRCELAVLHTGDHAQAGESWPRSEREQVAFQRTQVDLVRLHQGWTRGRAARG